MTIPKIYNSIIESKTGIKIPVFLSGRTMESKYNPEREADSLLQTITQSFSFFTVFGIGSGLFITKLIQKFPEATILCVENTQEDLNFLSQFNFVSALKNNPNIILTTVQNLNEMLINNYIPALHGDMKIIEMLGWKNENSQYIQQIQEEINKALKLIAADYSVQTHFGKLWQHNILNNLNYISKNPVDLQIKTNKKTAVIVAAGPSLDEKIEYIKQNISDYFIISTDTAYSSLIKNQIFPEIVISIDGQFISHQHFLHKKTNSTIFAFDLCSNNSCIQKAGNKYFFFNSGHPLSMLASKNMNIISLYTGAGTVTISALDLAFFLGFQNILVIAADFAYINEKPYAKGTYLDGIYRNSETKIQNAETSFSKLMYRTQLKQVNTDSKTTDVLISYKNSFEEYLSLKNCNWSRNGNIYEIINNSSLNKIDFVMNYSFNMKNFYIQAEESYSNQDFRFLLPFIAYLRNKNKNESFENLHKLAYSYFVRYNNFI